MKDYMKDLNKRQAEKEAALGRIGVDLQKITREIEEEGARSARAVDAGDQAAYTAARIQLDYLKQRREALQKQRDKMATESVIDERTFNSIQAAMLQDSEPIREKMLTQLFKDWQQLLDHFNESKAELEKFDTACKKLAKMAGTSGITNMAGRSNEIALWISGVERERSFAQLKIIAENTWK